MLSTAVALVPSTPRAMMHAPAEQTFAAMVQMGQSLVGTGFLPDHVKNGPQAAAIILAGRELGMEPMRALRSLSLVKGKITEAADSQLARFKTDGGRAQFAELSDTEAVLHLVHPNGDKHTETFTLNDAQKAGLLSSSMYGKFPKAMLRSRVITAGLKSLGWEGGSGVYDPSELEVPAPRASDDVAMVDVEPAALPTPRAPMTLAQAEDVAVGKGEKRTRLGDTRTERLRDLEVYYAEKGHATNLAAVQMVLADRADTAETEALDAVESAA